MKKLIMFALALSMCVTLCACGGKSIDPEHEKILSLLEEERYDEAIYRIEELRDAPETNEDGEEITEALDEHQKNSLYSTATSFLDNFNPMSGSSSRSFYDNRTGEQVECKTVAECFKFVTDILLELDDYEDSKAYLDRIYKVDGMLLSYNISYTDALGTEHSENYNYYNYDRDGKLVEAYSARDMFDYYTGISRYTGITIEYDKDGNAVKKILGSLDSPSAVITYTYENGKVKTENCKTSSGDDFTVTYVYDSNGNLSEMQNIPNESWGYEDDTVTVKFTYDNDGNIIKESIETSDNRRQYITYKYEDGKLVYKEKSFGDYTERGADHTVNSADYTSWEYTYDEEGRVATVTMYDLGYLNENREQVNYSGEVITDPDLEFPRTTTYSYGTFYGVEDAE